MEVKLLQHKEQQRLLANHQKLREKPGTNPSYSPQKEATPADTLVWDFWLPEMWDKHFCCLILPGCGTLLWLPQQTNNAHADTTYCENIPVSLVSYSVFSLPFCFHFPSFPHVFSDACGLCGPIPLPCKVSHSQFHLKLSASGGYRTQGTCHLRDRWGIRNCLVPPLNSSVQFICCLTLKKFNKARCQWCCWGRTGFEVQTKQNQTWVKLALLIYWLLEDILNPLMMQWGTEHPAVPSVSPPTKAGTVRQDTKSLLWPCLPLTPYLQNPREGSRPGPWSPPSWV